MMQQGPGPKARGARTDRIGYGKCGGETKGKRIRAENGGLRHTKLRRQREYLHATLYPAIRRQVRRRTRPGQPGRANAGLRARAARIEGRLRAAGLIG